MWLKIFLYFLSFPSLFFMRWDFSKKFLALFFFLVVLYNVLAIGYNFWAFTIEHKDWMKPYTDYQYSLSSEEWVMPSIDRPVPAFHPASFFSHPMFMFISTDQYLPINMKHMNFSTENKNSLSELVPTDAVEYFILAGIILLVCQYLYAAARDRIFPEVASASIPALFSGAFWLAFLFRIFKFPARIHRLILEPVLLLIFAVYLLLYDQVALSLLVLINTIFYFLASQLDFSEYTKFYLNESKELQSGTQSTRPKGHKKAKEENLRSVVRVYSSNHIDAPIPIHKISRSLPQEYQCLIDTDSKNLNQKRS